MSRRTKRHLVYALAVVVSALTFTPLVIPAGVPEPWVLGMPRTLWAGVLVTMALVFLTYLATRFSPSDEEKPEDAAPIDACSTRSP